MKGETDARCSTPLALAPPSVYLHHPLHNRESALHYIMTRMELERGSSPAHSHPLMNSDRMMHALLPCCLPAYRRYPYMDLQDLKLYRLSELYRVRMKREGAPSPAPSHLSIKSDMSMDPPQNLRSEISPLTPRMKPEGAPSPAPSHPFIKSDMSMDPPQNFQSGNSPVTPRRYPYMDLQDLYPYPLSELYRLRMKLEGAPSPAPSHLSIKSDMSMDPPQNFRSEISPLTPRMILEGAPSPAPSHLSTKSDMSMDPPQNFQRGNSPVTPRMKLEEEAPSPAPSHLSTKSDMSMDPPQNLQRVKSPVMPRMKLKGAPSPAPSYLSMKSDMSMDPPQNLRSGNSPVTPRMKRKEAPSPAPSHLSMKSDMSMDPPQNFRSGISPLTSSLLTEDDFRCSVCTEVLKDPVSIPCGHSYCRQCITLYWAQPNHAGHYACPQCSQRYSCCPALNTNSALAKMVLKLQKFSPVLPAHCYAGPGDVACDFCTGKKLRAVKFCLNCSASYCESHVRQHYTVPVLQRHTLVEPEHQDSKPKEQSDIKTEDSNQLSGCKRKKLEQLHDMNNGVLKHVNDVQTPTEQPQQMQQPCEGTGKQLDDTQCCQDNDHSHEQMPEKQGKVSEDICVDIVMTEKNSTRSRIQPHLQALREKLNCQYEWQDLLKKKGQELQEKKRQELQERKELYQKLTELLEVQKQLEEEQKEQRMTAPKLLQEEQWYELLQLQLETQQELQKQQELLTVQERKLQEEQEQQEQKLLELLQKQCQELQELRNQRKKQAQMPKESKQEQQLKEQKQQKQKQQQMEPKQEQQLKEPKQEQQQMEQKQEQQQMEQKQEQQQMEQKQEQQQMEQKQEQQQMEQKQEQQQMEQKQEQQLWPRSDCQPKFDF